MLVTHLDKNFMYWGELFVQSVHKYAPQESLYISGVNLSIEDIKQLETYHDKIEVKNHSLQADDLDSLHKVRKDMPSVWAVLLQGRISKVILEVLEKDLAKDYFFLNADMFVRQPFSPLQKEVGLCLNSSHRHKSPHQLLNGVIGLRGGNTMVLEFALAYEEMHKKGLVVQYDGKEEEFCIDYHGDQIHLYKIYKEYRNKLQFEEFIHDDFFTLENKKGKLWSAPRLEKERALQQFRKALEC